MDAISEDHGFLDEIVYILESQIRYDLSSKLCRFAQRMDIEVDSTWKPPTLHTGSKILVEDKTLDATMVQEVEPEDIFVGVTTDGFFYLK
tara:strand:- start:342 stop:611 length:270 start_codon:yes stop_codon:yes gene_type:complete